MNDPRLIVPVAPLISATSFRVFTDDRDHLRIAIRENDIDHIFETDSTVDIGMKDGTRYTVVESFDEVMQILSNPFYNVPADKDA